MHKLAALAGLLLIPSVALGAQFAPGSLFLSESSVVEGDAVLIHAVVQNDSDAKFPGQVVFKDGEDELGKVAVALAVDEVRSVSVSWKPAAGRHTVVAELQDSKGAVAQSQSATFSVKEKPKPALAAASSTGPAAVGSSADIQAKIDSLSPAVGGATAPFFRLVDGGREAIAEVLDAQIAKTKPKIASTPGIVAGAETIQTPDQGSWFWSMVNTVYFYVLTVLRAAVGSAGVFYPLLAAVFFFVLWRTFKRFRRA